MRCIIGLSSLVFAHQCKNNDEVILMEQIINAIITIFDYVRSVWLFNFVNPHQYMIKTLRALSTLNNVHHQQYHHKSRVLITKLIESVLRGHQSADHIIQIVNSLQHHDDSLSLQMILIIETILLRNSIQLL